VGTDGVLGDEPRQERRGVESVKACESRSQGIKARLPIREPPNQSLGLFCWPRAIVCRMHVLVRTAMRDRAAHAAGWSGAR